LEFDPNRTAFIALVLYKDGDRKYIIASKDMKVGDLVISGDNVDIKEGYAMPIGKIPSGTLVYNIQLNSKSNAVMVRSAGSSAQVMGEQGKFTQVKLPSGEVRLIESICYATVGQVSNTDHMNERIGNAGRRRHMGIRPTVRGVAQHADSHPHGGGQGKGGRHGTGGPAVDPWGHKKGKKTRNNTRTNKYIVSNRHKKL
jgi:large subunit ribosomal protein L2